MISVVVQLPKDSSLRMTEVAASMAALAVGNGAVARVTVTQAWTLRVQSSSNDVGAIQAAVQEACQKVSPDCVVSVVSNAPARRALLAARRALGDPIELSVVRSLSDGDVLTEAVPLDASGVTVLASALDAVDAQLQLTQAGGASAAEALSSAANLTQEAVAGRISLDLHLDAALLSVAISNPIFPPLPPPSPPPLPPSLPPSPPPLPLQPGSTSQIVVYWNVTLAGTVDAFNASHFACTVARLLNVSCSRVDLRFTAASVKVILAIRMETEADASSSVGTLSDLTEAGQKGTYPRILTSYAFVGS